MEKYRARRFGPKKIQHDGGCGKKNIRHGNIALERRLQETEDSSFVTVIFF